MAKPKTERTISRLLLVRNNSTVSTRLESVSEVSSVRYSKNRRDRAVTEAATMCGDVPARPAETMVKNSSRLAAASGVSLGMCGTRELRITVPAGLRSVSVMRFARWIKRSKAAVRALSFDSLHPRMTSGNIDGIKCRSEVGRYVTSSWIASSLSRRAGEGVLSAVDNSKACNSSLRSINALCPVSVLARRGMSLYAFLMSWGSDASRFSTTAAIRKRFAKLVRGR